MKLGDGGEAFFVFETSADVPEGLQTSPLISPATSPDSFTAQGVSTADALEEPEYLDLSAKGSRRRPASTIFQTHGLPIPGPGQRLQSDLGMLLLSKWVMNIKADNSLGSITPLSSSPPEPHDRPVSGDWSSSNSMPRVTLERSASEELLSVIAKDGLSPFDQSIKMPLADRASEPPSRAENPSHARFSARSTSPPSVSKSEALNRAIALSKKLEGSNIPSHVTESGDLMLDMEGYKSSEEEALRAELVARKILAEELKGNYDIGALIGADEHGNLWIYSSEEAKEAANRKSILAHHSTVMDISETASDPGYQSDEERNYSNSSEAPIKLQHAPSERLGVGLVTPPQTPPDNVLAGDLNRNYAKTLRLTSDQLKALKLKPGPNTMSFSVNRATCQAYMYYWSYNVPVVISDIDGTITK